MLNLIIYPPAFKEVSASPFCVKAYYMMQMSGLDWQPEETFDPRKMPMGKLPVLRDGGELIADSNIIRRHLETKYAIEFDQGLNQREKAVSASVIRMLEDSLYFSIVCDRWLDDDNWPMVRETYFSTIPGLVRGLVTGKMRKEVKKGLDMQGIARFTEQERLERTKTDFQTLENLLEDKPFLFGENPTFADTCAVAMLASCGPDEFDSEITRLYRSNETLVSYVERGRSAFAAMAASHQDAA